MPLTVTKENFDLEVIKSEKPVLIDFWAAWCGPCKMISPIIDEIAKENSDIKVVKINVDKESELAASFQIMSIPTLAVVKEGQIVNRVSGVRPKEAILEMLK
ncbi:thiol reductase thioredoxin [endosymbiont 'TC1' of Trimyema compressum]|uniref:thioredoxin n=1 Tax=endosymbiont 'TC1' of Trimyema compressum TaxID=243899 RepID=UPI0007F04EB1|nr:thioredoxin [endosymbiont 'TC1' of Trimyema compressum]AMP19778.1 thiol reductase thioredoxin [endosymbiont 'TC1' of Trimyema compressum]